MGKLGLRASGRAALVLLPLALGATSCSGGDGGSSVDASAATTLALCRDERHVVAFDYFGTLTLSDTNLGDWLAEARVTPPARPGAAEVANAYRALGYEVLYVTTAPAEILLDGRPLGDHIAEWLTQNGFPMGDGTTVSVWDGDHTPMDWIAARLGQLTDEGASVDAAYTDNEDKAFAFKTAVRSERVFTLGAGASTSGSTPIPGDDMVAHAAGLAGLDQVCRAG